MYVLVNFSDIVLLLFLFCHIFSTAYLTLLDFFLLIPSMMMITQTSNKIKIPSIITIKMTDDDDDEEDDKELQQEHGTAYIT